MRIRKKKRVEYSRNKRSVESSLYGGRGLSTEQQFKAQLLRHEDFQAQWQEIASEEKTLWVPIAMLSQRHKALMKERTQTKDLLNMYMAIDMKDKALKYVSRMDELDIEMVKVNQEINETKEGITTRKRKIDSKKERLESLRSSQCTSSTAVTAKTDTDGQQSDMVPATLNLTFPQAEMDTLTTPDDND